VSAGTDQLRRANTSLVLRSLRRHGPATRAELAQRTGLAKATSGAVVAGLVSAGAVSEAAEEPARDGTRGRPGRPVALRGDRFLGLGLELNVDYVSAVVLDLAGVVALSQSRPAGTATGTDPVEVLLELASEIRELYAGSGSQLVGATVAVPALVRDDDRTVAWAPNLRLHGADLATRLEAVLPGCGPVQISNDANCAAYAEAHHGAAVGVEHALYLTGTVGIGAGIIEAGQLVKGAAGFAGEVGHMPLGDPDAPCGCGRRGCWEASIGLHAVLAAVGMTELETPVETARAVAARAGGDPAVRAVLTRVGRELVLGPARQVLDERLVSPVQVRPELRLSTLGIRAAALGAAEQSFTAVLAGERDLSPSQA